MRHEITRTCPDCKHENVMYKEEYSIPLSIARDEGMSLVELMKKHHSEPLVEYACEQDECPGNLEQALINQQLGVEPEPGEPTRRRRDHPQQYLLAESPRVLCLKLVRHHYDRQSRQSIKLFDDVDFEEELDLTDLTKSGKSLKYRLYCVAAHEGPDLQRGHWIAAVRHRNGDEFDVVNDERFRKSRQGFMAARKPGIYTDGWWRPFDPVMLVYLKIEDGEEDEADVEADFEAEDEAEDEADVEAGGEVESEESEESEEE